MGLAVNSLANLASRLLFNPAWGSRMTIIVPTENVIAVQTEVGFERTLESLRVELPRHEFRILWEVDFSRELHSHIGSPYAVLIVWHPASAYQALLNDPNGGLMVPFNLAVYRKGSITTVSVLIQPSLRPEASLGIRTLGQELNWRLRHILLHLGTYERQGGQGSARHASAARGDGGGEWETNASTRRVPSRTA